MQNQFRLADLLARDIVAQWFEGVAVIQLVCRHLRAPGCKTAGFPGAENILIATGGLVTVAGGSDDRPVEAAAHVLGLMLGNDVPVRLRLAVTQATATDGGFSTLTEFSEALAYFERPNPETIVEAFRQRALMAAPRQIAPAMRIDAPQVVDKQKTVAPTSPRPRRGVSRLAIVVAAFFLVACTLIWAIGHSLPDLLAAKVASAESAPSDALPVHSSPKSSTAAKSAPQRDTSVKAAATNRRAAPAASIARSVVAPPSEFQVVATTLSYRYPTVLPGVEVAAIPATSELGVAASDTVMNPEQETAERIYSRADPQVTAPLSVYPKFPNDAPGASAARATRLELTIAANGLVEQVRMLTVPRNIHEFMLLSAAKAWRFEPARFNGRPVRFRQVMSLTVLP
jgi:hypothetical protein